MSFVSKLAACALALGIGAAATPVSAGIVLNFAGLNGANYEPVGQYYNGGTGGLGSSGGTNYGISFVNALACNGLPDSCETTAIPGGPGANALTFSQGSGDIMNVGAGFNTGFSFFYSAPQQGGSVQVWSELNAAGSLLASLTLSTTTDGASLTGAARDGCTVGVLVAGYCPYEAVGVTFSGVAKSVNFAGGADYILFADITIGSQTAGDSGGTGVPEPASLVLLCFGIAGLGAVRRFARA